MDQEQEQDQAGDRGQTGALGKRCKEKEQEQELKQEQEQDQA